MIEEYRKFIKEKATKDDEGILKKLYNNTIGLFKICKHYFMIILVGSKKDDGNDFLSFFSKYKIQLEV